MPEEVVPAAKLIFTGDPLVCPLLLLLSPESARQNGAEVVRHPKRESEANKGADHF